MEKSPDAFRTISEVADFLETPAHVLRFWETRFPQVRPVKRAGGRRYYRPSDVALLSGIRQLLHDQGMTIRGVQKILREQGVKHVCGLGALADDAGIDDAWPGDDVALTGDPDAAAPEGVTDPDATDEGPAAAHKPVVLTLVTSELRDPEPVLDLFSRLALADQDDAAPEAAETLTPDPVAEAAHGTGFDGTDDVVALWPGAGQDAPPLRDAVDDPVDADGVSDGGAADPDPADGPLISADLSGADTGAVAGPLESAPDDSDRAGPSRDLALASDLKIVLPQGADPDPAPEVENAHPGPQSGAPVDPDAPPLSRRLVIEVPAAGSEPRRESIRPEVVHPSPRVDALRVDSDFAGPTRAMRLRSLDAATLADHGQDLRDLQARLAALRGRMAQAARLRKP